MYRILLGLAIFATYLENAFVEANCTQLPAPELSNILGGAFNSRYMSIEKPPVMEDEPVDNDGSGKRGDLPGLYPSFYVDEDYHQQLGGDAAWAVNHIEDTGNPVLVPRTKRTTFDSLLEEMSKESRPSRSSRGRGQPANDNPSRPWDCEAKIRWVDLGQEYFPRFLRTIECGRTNCWYGHYGCTPRSFTVKLLRRRRGECAPMKATETTEGLPSELGELWVWEERGVTFCCECTSKWKV